MKILFIEMKYIGKYITFMKNQSKRLNKFLFYKTNPIFSMNNYLFFNGLIYVWCILTDCVKRMFVGEEKICGFGNGSLMGASFCSVFDLVQYVADIRMSMSCMINIERVPVRGIEGIDVRLFG